MKLEIKHRVYAKYKSNFSSNRFQLNSKFNLITCRILASFIKNLCPSLKNLTKLKQNLRWHEIEMKTLNGLFCDILVAKNNIK